MAIKYLGTREADRDAPEALEFISGVKTTRQKDKTVYLFLADDCDTTVTEILATSPLPALDSTVDGMIIHKRTPKEIATVIHPDSGVQTILWEVTIEGDSKFNESNQGGGSGGGSPITIEWMQEQAVESWSVMEEEERLAYDIDSGAPFNTSCGEPILVFRKVMYPVLNLLRVEEYPFDPNMILTYANHINSKEFRGAPRGHVLCLPMKSEAFQYGELILVKVTYQFKFHVEPYAKFSGATYLNTSFGVETAPHPFQIQVLHQGAKYRKLAADDPIVWTDKEGNPGTVNLKADGTVELDEAKPVFIVGNRYLEADFTQLGL